MIITENVFGNTYFGVLFRDLLSNQTIKSRSLLYHHRVSFHGQLFHLFPLLTLSTSFPLLPGGNHFCFVSGAKTLLGEVDKREKDTKTGNLSESWS